VTTALAAQSRWDECLASLEAFPVADIIASILEQALPELLDTGRTATVRRWLALASSNDIAKPIVLLADAEIALREGDGVRAQVLGERAGGLIGKGDTAARAFLVAGRAAHLRDNRDAARANCKVAEGLATSLETRVQAQWTQFTSAVEERGPEAAAIVERMGQVEDDRPDHALRVHYAHAFMLLEIEGEAFTAASEFKLASGLLDRVRDPVLRTSFLNLYSHVMLVVGHYDEALALAQRQIEEADANGVDFAKDHALLRQASAFIGLRNLRAAQRTIAELESRSEVFTDYILRTMNIQAARLRIATGDLRRAEIILGRAGPCQTPSPEQLAYHGLVVAALGGVSEGETILREAHDIARTFDAIAITDLGLAVIDLQRDPTKRATPIYSVLIAAIDKGRVDAVVTACRIFPELARAGAKNAHVARALTEVFIRSRDIDLGRRTGLPMPRELRRNEGLSRRELEVYELLVQGRTNPEIARTLFISESTTKVHVRHIFEKLGVHTRAEAAHATLEAPS
jgi:ATP/maltotriose-dependent transcriptional regulator MalT